MHKILVEKHYVKYCNFFMINLKSKHHNVTHYKTVLKKNNPPSHLNVVFESRNQLLKNLLQMSPILVKILLIYLL